MRKFLVLRADMSAEEVMLASEEFRKAVAGALDYSLERVHASLTVKPTLVEGKDGMSISFSVMVDGRIPNEKESERIRVLLFEESTFTKVDEGLPN